MSNDASSRQVRTQRVIKQAFSRSDLVVLGVTFLTFFLLTCGYFIVSYFTDIPYEDRSGLESMVLGAIFTGAVGLGFLIVVLVVGMVMIRLQRQVFLGNALRVEYSDYAWLRDWVNEVAADLKLPRIEMFVTQDPYMNAYAFGFARPYTIVLHSGSIRYLTNDEIKAVVVHEMAHIKYGHTTASVYLLPFLSVPVVGGVFSWLAGFWQRRTEYTADRLALLYLAEPELLKEALIKVHVGPDVAKDLTEAARQWMGVATNQSFNRFAQTFSNHPFLVRRLAQIDRWTSVIEPVVQSRPE